MFLENKLPISAYTKCYEYEKHLKINKDIQDLKQIAFHLAGSTGNGTLGYNYSTFMRPHPQPPNNLEHRSLSPQVPHTYHNPTLMASPYSTLPRRPLPGNGHQPPVLLPIMASAVGRNSPLLELTGMTGVTGLRDANHRSSSLGRNSSLFHDKHQRAKTAMSPPISSDDRESCV